MTLNEKEIQITGKSIKVTNKEYELLRLYIVEGLTVKEISVHVGSTERSIEKQIEYLRRRMNCVNIRQLVFRLTNANVFQSKEIDTDPEQLVGKAEAAQMLGISVDTLNRWALSGKIRSIKIGKYRRFALADIRGLSATG